LEKWKVGKIMVKIKTKKQIDLSMLINWAWHNIENVEIDFLKTDNTNNYGNYNKINFSDENSTFYTDEVLDNELTVDVYVEITEDTVIPKLIERWEYNDKEHERFRYIEHENKSINKVLFVTQNKVEATHFYAEIDGELKLIWREGKLI
jgi:hypothetical protein